MEIEQIPRSARKWQTLVEKNLGLVATIFTFLFLSIRLLVISKGYDQTAIFVLSHSDKVPLLLGMVLPFIPGFCIVASMTLGWTAIAKGSLLTKWNLIILLVVAELFFSAGIFAGNWRDWIWGVLIAIGLLNLPWWQISPKKRAENPFIPHKREY